MSKPSSDYDFVFKILLIGNSSVGKSSLLMRFADDTFHEAFLPTIGVDFKIRTILNEGSLVKLQMWDTAGQEKFRNITTAYYKGSQGVLLVYDICDRKSFDDAKSWLNEIEKYANPNIVKILVGNKADMNRSRTVSQEEAMTYAQNQNMNYVEVSAKTNKNVEYVFQELSKSMKKNFSKPYVEKYKTTKTWNLLIREVTKQKKSTCC